MLSEKEGWEEIVTESQIWSPEKIGDSIQGIYTEMKSDVGQWRKKRYTLELENETRYVYGTTDIDEKFKQIHIGDEVHIELKKCIPSRPPKKPFKVFQVFRRKGSEQDESQLMDYEDSEAEETIKIIRVELGPNSSDEEVIKYAEKWEDLKEEDVSRIKICLAQHKKVEGK
jgi:hypothetical protein